MLFNEKCELVSRPVVETVKVICPKESLRKIKKTDFFTTNILGRIHNRF